MVQSQGSIAIGSSLLSQAKENDSNAIEVMFRQFIPEDERIHYVQYLGLKGLWGIGTHEFACLTDRRVADITVKYFGEVNYQDGYLECVTSSIIHQPSKIKLYLFIGFYGFTLFILFLGPFIAFFFPALFLFLIVLLVPLPFIVQAYYSFAKCGAVLAVADGIPIYMFSSRKYLSRVNSLCRQVTMAREDRIKFTKKLH